MRARRIYTPHHGIAAQFPGNAVLLSWHKPPPTPRKSGNRIAFLGPIIARQRPDIASRMAAEFEEPLVVFGEILEPLLDGLPIELRARGPTWLDGIGAIIHPAVMTHEPRALLEARANGVLVYATETCGLGPSEYLLLNQFPMARAKK